MYHFTRLGMVGLAADVDFGSSSSPQQTRRVTSAAAKVVPLPRNGTCTISPALVWFRIGRRIKLDRFLCGMIEFLLRAAPTMPLSNDPAPSGPTKSASARLQHLQSGYQ